MKQLSILAMLLAACACAHATMPKFDPPDPRLDKKVTLDVNNTKLEEVAKSLSEQTGITIKAGSGQRDWKVRERMVTIHAKDMPLGKMMDELSRVLGFYVSREGKEGEWSYIVWQDKKSRDLEAEMVTAQTEAEAQRIKAMRESAIDGAEKALKMSPEEAMKLKDKDPWTAYMGGTKTGRGFAGMLSSLKSQFPTEYDLMMRGKRAGFPLTGLPAGMQKSVNDASTGGMASMFKGMMGDKAQSLTPVQLTSMPMDDMMGGGMAGQIGMSGLLFITGMKPGDKPDPNNPIGGMPMTFFPMASPNSVAAGAFGEMLFGVESGESMEEASKKVESKFKGSEFLSETLAHESPTEKTPPTDPELTREIEIKADALPKADLASMGNGFGGGKDAESQGKTLAEISRALGMPVLFESFDQLMPLSIFVKAGKQPAYKILVALEKGNYSWDRGDGTLRIRPSDWALRRSYLIPEGYIAYYKDLLKKQEVFTLDDLVGMVSGLTDNQIQHTLLTDPDMSFLMMAIGSNMFGGSRSMLRFYGSLTADQKQTLQSDIGLPFNQLTDAQWDQLNNIITDRFGGLYVADGKIKMVPPSKDQDRLATQVYMLNIEVLVNGEKEPRKMTETIMVPGKTQIDGMKKMRKDVEDKAKEQQKKAASPTDPDAPKMPQPAPAK